MNQQFTLHQKMKHNFYTFLWSIVLTTFLLLFLSPSLLIGLLIIVLVLLPCCFLLRKFQIEEGNRISDKELLKINITCVCFGILIFLACQNYDRYLGMSIFIVNQVVFHMGEFLHVCFYKFHLLKWESFLINHSFGYNLALSLAMVEYFIESFFFDKLFAPVIVLGVLMTIVGHIFRIGAFLKAKESFHHQVQTKKAIDHTLVTDGIYSISRHPSYFGFWIFSLGQQAILCNPIAFIGYIPVLYRFFISRIQYEEYFLRQFFGQAYVNYANKTPILIPFIENFLQNLD